MRRRKDKRLVPFMNPYQIPKLVHQFKKKLCLSFNHLIQSNRGNKKESVRDFARNFLQI